MHIFLSLQGSHKSTSLIAAVLEPSLYSAAATTVSAFIVKQSKPEGYGTSWYSLKHKHPQMKKCNLAIKQHAPPFNLSQQSSYLNAYKTTVQFILSWFSLRYVIIWKAQEENFTLSTQLKKKKYDQSLLQNIRLMAFRKDPVLFFFQVFLNLWVWLAKVKVSAIWGNAVWPVFKPKMTSYKAGFCRAMRSQSKDGSGGFSSSPLCFVACGFCAEH